MRGLQPARRQNIQRKPAISRLHTCLLLAVAAATAAVVLWGGKRLFRAPQTMSARQCGQLSRYCSLVFFFFFFWFKALCSFSTQ